MNNNDRLDLDRFKSPLLEEDEDGFPLLDLTHEQDGELDTDKVSYLINLICELKTALVKQEDAFRAKVLVEAFKADNTLAHSLALKELHTLIAVHRDYQAKFKKVLDQYYDYSSHTQA